MSSYEPKHPFLTYRFTLETGHLISGGFSEVTGLQSEVEMEEYREGGRNDYAHHLPKTTSYQNIVLKRGLFDPALWDWFRDVRRGVIERRDISLALLDSQGEEVVRWHVLQAFPSRWTGPELQADSATVAAESIELVHEGLEMETA